MRRKVMVLLALTALVIASAAMSGVAGAAARQKPSRAGTEATTSEWRTKRLSNPDRVQLSDASGWLATFTVGSHTVTLRGKSRTFSESTTTATVTHSTWVRMLPRPFTGKVDTAWTRAALADTGPDVLAVAMQYVTGAPDVTAADGTVVSGDARYGPALADGSLEEGSDFNDYLGVSWDYDGVSDAPEERQRGSLDCSGYVRMILGYRLGMSMTLDPDGRRLPRRAFQMYASAPGVVTVADRGGQATTLTALAPGDLLFFDQSADDGTQLDHVGVFLGRDSVGGYRFLSSRKTVDGPTMGDVGGRSTVDGTGYYATAWRGARRV